MPIKTIIYPVEFGHEYWKEEQGAKIVIDQDSEKGTVFKCYVIGFKPEIDEGKRRAYCSYKPKIDGPFSIEFDVKVENVTPFVDGGETFVSLLSLYNAVNEKGESTSLLAIVNAEPNSRGSYPLTLELSTYGYKDKTIKKHVLSPTDNEFPLGKWVHLLVHGHRDGMIQVYQDGILSVQTPMLADPKYLRLLGFHAGLYGRFDTATFYNGPYTIKTYS